MLQYLLISWIFLLCMQLFVSFHVYSHTMMNTPVLHRSLKLSNIGFSKYLDGWPLKKFPRDCRLFTVAGRPYRNSTVYGRISEIKIPNTAVYRQVPGRPRQVYRDSTVYGTISELKMPNTAEYRQFPGCRFSTVLPGFLPKTFRHGHIRFRAEENRKKTR